MAEVVIKKEGSEQPFDPEKIRDSIRKACDQAEVSEARKEELVEQVSTVALEAASERSKISTTEIRGKLLTKLERMQPSVAKAWREYDQQRGRI
ncbi:MAG: ATP cone domain-containing protein [Candidatus Paceibacterota bacterium]